MLIFILEIYNWERIPLKLILKSEQFQKASITLSRIQKLRTFNNIELSRALNWRKHFKLFKFRQIRKYKIRTNIKKIHMYLSSLSRNWWLHISSMLIILTDFLMLSLKLTFSSSNSAFEIGIFEPSGILEGQCRGYTFTVWFVSLKSMITAAK